MSRRDNFDIIIFMQGEGDKKLFSIAAETYARDHNVSIEEALEVMRKDAEIDKKAKDLGQSISFAQTKVLINRAEREHKKGEDKK